MPRTSKPPDQPGSSEPAWAHRLAERRLHRDAGHEAVAPDVDWTLGAVDTLWALFDDAVEQANEALERSGAPERILLHRGRREYRMSLAGPEGEGRQITAFASLTLVGGRPSGGARISTTQTRASIVLLATAGGRRLRWIIAESKAPFDERVLGDLFLSVFGDDPAATLRLSSHYTLA